MNLKQYLETIKDFLKEYLNKSQTNGYVLGLSGGVDSSLVAALCKESVGKDKLTCIMMPIDSLPKDLEDALELAKALDLKYEIIDASEAFHKLVDIFEAQGIKLNQGSLTNLKVRIRMSILYAYGQTNNLLVVGTDNKPERYVGYFTKWGDGAADLLPIVHLLKREVVEASKILGVPTHLAERVPSAGLFEGQTDETEMGVSYQDLDDYLIGKEINADAKAKIERMHRISAHKREEIPSPSPFERDE